MCLCVLTQCLCDYARVEDNFQVLILSSYHRDARDQTQVVMLVSNHLSLLNHLTGPQTWALNSVQGLCSKAAPK